MKICLKQYISIEKRSTNIVEIDYEPVLGDVDVTQEEEPDRTSIYNFLDLILKIL